MRRLMERRVRISPALVVALIALFVALSAAAVATTTRLITGATIRDNSVTGADVRDKSLSAADFRGSPRGPAGAAGPAGTIGTHGPKGDPGAVGKRASPASRARREPTEPRDGVPLDEARPDQPAVRGRGGCGHFARVAAAWQLRAHRPSRGGELRQQRVRPLRHRGSG